MLRSSSRNGLALPIVLAEGWALIILSTLLGYGVGAIILQHGWGLPLAAVVGFVAGGLLLFGAPFVFARRQHV